MIILIILAVHNKIIIDLLITDFLEDQVSMGELAAFISYATAFPDGFLALVDTYDVIKYV